MIRDVFCSFDDFLRDRVPRGRRRRRSSSIPRLLSFLSRRLLLSIFGFFAVISFKNGVLKLSRVVRFKLIKNPGFALKMVSLERDVVRREFYRENPIRFVLFARSIV